MPATPTFNNQATLDILNEMKSFNFASLSSFEARQEKLREYISRIVVDVPAGSSQNQWGQESMGRINGVRVD